MAVSAAAVSQPEAESRLSELPGAASARLVQLRPRWCAAAARLSWRSGIMPVSHSGMNGILAGGGGHGGRGRSATVTTRRASLRTVILTTDSKLRASRT